MNKKMTLSFIIIANVLSMFKVSKATVRYKKLNGCFLAL